MLKNRLGFIRTHNNLIDARMICMVGVDFVFRTYNYTMPLFLLSVMFIMC